jgi:hypothetical protein
VGVVPGCESNYFGNGLIYLVQNTGDDSWQSTRLERVEQVILIFNSQSRTRTPLNFGIYTLLQM